MEWLINLGSFFIIIIIIILMSEQIWSKFCIIIHIRIKCFQKVWFLLYLYGCCILYVDVVFWWVILNVWCLLFFERFSQFGDLISFFFLSFPIIANRFSKVYFGSVRCLVGIVSGMTCYSVDVNKWLSVIVLARASV